MTITMRRSGGRSGASASRKPALLDRTKGRRQEKVIKVVIILPANVISMIIIIPAVVSSMIILMCRQEKRLALEEGLRRPPSQPLPSLRPLSQPPSLRLFFFCHPHHHRLLCYHYCCHHPHHCACHHHISYNLRPPAASLPWHSPVGQSSGQKYLTWTPGQVK